MRVNSVSDKTSSRHAKKEISRVSSVHFACFVFCGIILPSKAFASSENLLPGLKIWLVSFLVLKLCIFDVDFFQNCCMFQ